MVRTLPLFAFILMMAAPVYAEESVIKTDNPHITKASEQAVEIAKSFSEQEIGNLEIIKDGFGIIRSVKATDEIVGKTVKRCGKDNPDMKADMNAAYDTWKSNVTKVLDVKEKSLKAAINDGRFSKPKDVQSFLDTIDKAAQFAQDRMDAEKKIISTPSSCEGLKLKMDETYTQISELLTAVDFPVAELKPETAPRKAGEHE
ncbi:MAG: hypothetical protein ACK4NR_03450 [Micavibrio sp.]